MNPFVRMPGRQREPEWLQAAASLDHMLEFWEPRIKPWMERAGRAYFDVARDLAQKVTHCQPPSAQSRRAILMILPVAEVYAWAASLHDWCRRAGFWGDAGETFLWVRRNVAEKLDDDERTDLMLFGECKECVEEAGVHSNASPKRPFHVWNKRLPSIVREYAKRYPLTDYYPRELITVMTLVGEEAMRGYLGGFREAIGIDPDLPAEEQFRSDLAHAIRHVYTAADNPDVMVIESWGPSKKWEEGWRPEWARVAEPAADAPPDVRKKRRSRTQRAGAGARTR
ncbi:MAG: hypothetical protein HYT87_20255 [Nitrospirae bacterium]|nr:hypothetical protein [Nitrospirota bacterium]